MTDGGNASHTLSEAMRGDGDVITTGRGGDGAR